MNSSFNYFNDIWTEVQLICNNNYGITPGRNAQWIGENIYLKSKSINSFIYTECGVYKGTTFMPIYHLIDMLFDDYELFAIDSFEGFPEHVLSDKDGFNKFKELYKSGNITETHYRAAKKRWEKVVNNEHLTAGYFSDFRSEFHDRCKDKKNINIIQSSFDNLGAVYFNDKRINLVNRRKEFFRVTLEEIEEEVYKIEPESEFIKTTESREFRETLALLNAKKDELEKTELVEDKFPETL